MIANAARRGPRGCGRLALIVAILLGVLGMHAITSPVAVHSGGFGHGPAVAGQADHPGCERSAHPGEVPCPDDGTGHPGAVCQAGAVTFASALPAPSDPGTPVTPVSSSPLTATASEDAAHGTGCGPPSLTGLSISRT
ncbi:MAG TPA: DUF6153 family protein [Micromonosporaceae bacterium]